MRINVTTYLLAGLFVTAAGGAMADEACAPCETYRPKLFKRFGDHVNTPDGLAQDRHGNIFLAAPNFVDKSYPGAILKMDKRSGKWSIFMTGLVHPETGHGAPMGMEFGEDGNLYYCETSISQQELQIARDARGDRQSGPTVKVEPVVENIKLRQRPARAGGTRFFSRTPSLTWPAKIWAVCTACRSARSADRPVRLLPKEQARERPLLPCTTETKRWSTARTLLGGRSVHR